jgi:putative two-component system response regulator
VPHTDEPVTLLVVDDEEAIRSTLRRYLARQGYQVAAAASGEDALGVLAAREVTAVLLDVNLPGVSGIDLVPEILERAPAVALLMLTAVNDATTAALCMQRGALDYLLKPIDLAQLGRAVARALERRQVMLERQRAGRRQEAEAAAAQDHLAVATLEALVNALEARDPWLRGHSARVADLAAGVAAHLGRPPGEVEAVRTAGRLHDIGKIGIRDEVLNKQGPLSDDEYEHVKQHVLLGCRILAPLVHLRQVLAYVRSHHERWDGFGYPDRLAGEAIPLGARIIGAVEIYDALTTARSYQEKMTPAAAVERMRDLVGTVVDPAIHTALHAVVKRRHGPVVLDDARR